MPIVTLSSGDLHYMEHGRGVPLVLLHANPGDSRDFEAISPALVQHYRVLALDWPGYGASARPRAFAGWYLKHRTPTVRAMLERAATSQATAPSLVVNRSVWRGFIEAEHDLRQRATLIAAPTLLVFGARDPVISARQDGRLAASLIRGAKLVVMPAGHAPFAEVPDEFLAEVLPFIQRCAGDGETHEG